MSLLIQPVPSRIISLEEAAGFVPQAAKPSQMAITRDVWKVLLKQEGRTKDLQRMEKAEAKRARKAKR